jgi:hypothetical protein
MNELKILQEAWETPEPPAPATRAKARTALAMRAHASRAGAGSTAASHAGASHAGARPVGVPPRQSTAKPAGGRRLMARLGTRLAVAGALAAAVAIGAAVLPSVSGPGGPGKRAPAPIVPGIPAASADEALERAALAAERTPHTAPRPDQWIYTYERNNAPEGRRAGTDGPLRHVHERWRSVDGTREARIENGRMRIIKTPRTPAKRGRQEIPLLARGEDYETLSRLPTDPDALLRMAYRMFPANQRLPQTPDDSVYTLFTHILARGALPPRLEAAIFRAMKKIPGVTLDRNAVDVLGRPAVALGQTGSAGWMFEQTLLDRESYKYLGERSLIVKTVRTDKLGPGHEVARKGTELLFVRIKTAVVDRAGQRP